MLRPVNLSDACSSLSLICVFFSCLFVCFSVGRLSGMASAPRCTAPQLTPLLRSLRPPQLSRPSSTWSQWTRAAWLGRRGCAPETSSLRYELLCILLSSYPILSKRPRVEAVREGRGYARGLAPYRHGLTSFKFQSLRKGLLFFFLLFQSAVV